MKQETNSLAKKSKMNWWVERTKKVFTTISYIEHFLNLVSTISGCILIFPFASLIPIPTGTWSSAIRLKIYVIPQEIKEYKSIIKKKKIKHGKIVLLPKFKLSKISFKL